VARLDLLPVVLLVGIAGFVAAQVVGADTPVTPASAAAAELRRREALLAAGDRQTVHERLREGAPGTYIASLLGTDSLLLRWTNAPEQPVAVWIAPTSTVAGWTPRHATYAREAFLRWERELPLRFRFVPDSAAADVVVGWVDALPRREQVGKSLRLFDDRGAIRRAEVEIAVRNANGRDIPEGVARLIALHEVGHALGLEHSPDPHDVMAARYDGRGAGLTPADLATARLLYSVPPGEYR
jgi:hypothetical protein